MNELLHLYFTEKGSLLQIGDNVIKLNKLMKAQSMGREYANLFGRLLGPEWVQGRGVKKKHDFEFELACKLIPFLYSIESHM